MYTAAAKGGREERSGDVGTLRVRSAAAISLLSAGPEVQPRSQAAGSSTVRSPPRSSSQLPRRTALIQPRGSDAYGFLHLGCGYLNSISREAPENLTLSRYIIWSAVVLLGLRSGEGQLSMCACDCVRTRGVAQVSRSRMERSVSEQTLCSCV